MALKDIELSLMTFPQRWDGPSGTLSLNILLLPVGDPTAALGTGPKFAGTSVPVILNFASGLELAAVHNHGADADAFLCRNASNSGANAF